MKILHTSGYDRQGYLESIDHRDVLSEVVREFLTFIPHFLATSLESLCISYPGQIRPIRVAQNRNNEHVKLVRPELYVQTVVPE